MFSKDTDTEADTTASDADGDIKPVPAQVEVKPVTTPEAKTETTSEAAPAAVPPKPATPPQLKEGRYNFDWQGTPIAQSLYAVAKIAHKDVVVNGDLEGKVFISLHNVTCNQAMDYLSNAFNFNWMVDDNAIVVSTSELMLQSQVFKIHHAVDMDKIKEEQDEEGYQTDYPTNRTVVTEDVQLLEETAAATEQGTGNR